MAMAYDDRVETTNQMIFSRPDFLLASNCFGPNKHSKKEQSLLKDIGTFLVDDLSSDCKKVDVATAPTAQPHDLDSGAWNSISYS